MKKHRWFSRLFTLPLAVLVLLPSLVLPALERADLAHETTIASEHDPASCPQAHDHTLCTHIGGTRAAPASGVLRVAEPDFVGLVEVAVHSATHSPVRRVGPPSRAPPRA